MRLTGVRSRTLMILILLSALILAGFIQLSRADPLDLVDLELRIFVLAPFLLLILAKLGLVLGVRTKRLRSSESVDTSAMEGLRGDESPF